MTKNEAIEKLNMLNDALNEQRFDADESSEALQIAIEALEEVQQYREIEKELKEHYHANVDMSLLMQHFMDIVFKGNKHEGFVLLTNEDAKLWEEYKVIGTPEECRKSVSICKAMIERKLTPENMEEYMKFEDECVKRGFTFSSLLEAREKQVVKAPIIKFKNGEFAQKKCTCCGNIIMPFDGKYCNTCGQRLEK